MCVPLVPEMPPVPINGYITLVCNGKERRITISDLAGLTKARDKFSKSTRDLDDLFLGEDIMGWLLKAASEPVKQEEQPVTRGLGALGLQNLGRGLRGETAHTIVTDEMPSHRHDVADPGYSGNSVFGLAPVARIGTIDGQPSQGDGLGLLSVAHPARIMVIKQRQHHDDIAVPMKSERELLIERIVEATKLAAGG